MPAQVSRDGPKVATSSSTNCRRSDPVLARNDLDDPRHPGTSDVTLGLRMLDTPLFPLDPLSYFCDEFGSAKKNLTH